MNEARTRLDCIEVGPQDATRAVIWLHGLGADGSDFEPIVPLLGLPEARFVFPNAPVRPVTINQGFRMRAWYDITSLAPSTTREPESDIREAALQLEATIEHELSRGVEPQHLVLAGFSQGGAMALHVGLRYPKALAGVMVLSAYALLPDTIAAESHEANASTPFFFGHGAQDPVVPIGRGQEAMALATRPERKAEFNAYAMGHEVCPAEIQKIGEWLRARLA